MLKRSLPSIGSALGGGFRTPVIPAIAACLFAAADLPAQTGRGPQPQVCDRSCWNARSAGLSSTIPELNRAVVHHTAGTYGNQSLEHSKSLIRASQNHHMDNNGWRDIGYHFMVDALGNRFEGRRGALSAGTYYRGAHDGTNNRSYGFSVMGNYETSGNHPGHAFTAASRNALMDLIAWRMPEGWTPYGTSWYSSSLPNEGRVEFHRTVARHTTKTLCPGTNIINYVTYDYNGGPFRDGIAARRGGSTFSAGDWVRSTADPNLNVRAGPGTSFEIIGGLPFHTVAHILPHADNRTVANSHTWWHVAALPDGRKGWVAEAFLEETSPPEPVLDLVVDNSDPGFHASANWGSATWADDKYGPDYRFRDTEPVNDPATWTADLPYAGSYFVYAWWSESPSRPTAAPYIVSHAAGNTHVPMDQTANGGRWNLLGVFTFTSGPATVRLLASATSGDRVIADAVRFVTYQEAPPEYTVSVEVEGEGTVSVSPGQNVYLEGDSIQVSAEPAVEFDFHSWTGSISGTDNPLNIDVTADVGLVAHFHRTYDAWERARFTEQERGQNGFTAPDNDPFHRGVSNLAAYALALDIRAPDRAALPRVEREGDRLTFVFRRLLDDPDIRYKVEVSGDLTAWTPLDLQENTVEITRDPGSSTETVKVVLEPENAGARFIRLHIER